MIWMISIKMTRPFRLSGSRNAMTIVPAIAPRKRRVSIHLVFLNISLICVMGVARKHELYICQFYPMMLITCPME